MKALILIWSLLLPYMAFGQATSSDTQYRNDGETLINGSFEQGKKGYTFTVGSGSTVWSTQSTNSLTGKAMELTLSAQTFSFKSATTQGAKLSNQNGYIEVYLSASASGAEFCPLVDGVSAPTTTPNECQPIIHGVGFKPYGIQKVFGATSLNYEIRGVSNASYTGTIRIDDGSVSKKSIVTSYAGMSLVGTVTISACSTAWITTSTTLVDYPTVAGCSYSVTGKALAPLTNIPAIRFAQLEAGEYILEYDGQLYSAVANRNAYYQFGDGTNLARENVAHYGGTSTVAVPEISQSISYSTAQSNITLAVKTKVDSGGSSYLYGTNGNPGVIKVWHIPNKPISSISSSNGWFIDVNIGGALVSLGNSSVASYTEITNASLDMVINTAKGSAPAEIPCASGTASTGLTCSGANESIGVAFIPPKTGKYRACFSVSHQVANNGVTFQLIETSNTSSAILTEGGDRVNFYSASTTSVPAKVCGNFTFNDTSKKTLRLMFEQIGGGTTSQVLADRAVTEGQRDVRVTVDPVVENIQAGLQGYNYTPNTVNVEMFSVSYGTTNATTVCSASPCSYLDQIGNAVTSVTRSGAGQYVLNLRKTYTKLKCTNSLMISTASPGNGSDLNCSSSASCSFVTGTSGVGTRNDAYGTLICQGIPQ